MAGKRRQFTPEFKLEAVRMANGSERSLSQVARELIRSYSEHIEPEYEYPHVDFTSINNIGYVTTTFATQCAKHDEFRTGESCNRHLPQNQLGHALLPQVVPSVKTNFARILLGSLIAMSAIIRSYLLPKLTQVHTQSRALITVGILLSAGCDQPLSPVVIGEPFSSVDANGNTTCALTVSGLAYCWGRGDSGQLGNGGTANSSLPVPVSGQLEFTELSVGYYHACGITKSDTAYCWGATIDIDNFGQLGSGSASGESSSPIPVYSEHEFATITAGKLHTCALTAAGKAFCWGANVYGQLGDGTLTNRAAPSAVATNESFRWLSAGDAHTCGVTLGPGDVLCWGDNFFGVVTDGTNTSDFCRGGYDTRCTPYPFPVKSSGGFLKVEAGFDRSCALAVTGIPICWGAEDAEVSDAPEVDMITVGGSHACGTSSTGAGYCWGNNRLGNLGNGSPEDSEIPVLVAGSHDFRSVTAGLFHTCGITTAGKLYCWGSNRDSQLGVGSEEVDVCGLEHPCSRTPIAVKTNGEDGL